MNDDQDPGEVTKEAPEGWLEALRRSDEDLAAGRVVPASVVLAEIEETIAAIEAALAVKGQAATDER